MSAARMGALYEEHLMLGASLREGSGGEAVAVASYALEQDPRRVVGEGGALLCDLTGAAYLLVAGERAAALASLALAGRELGVGELAFEAALSGDGAVCAVPLALRTGDEELVLVDPTGRGGVLAGWVRFLAGLEQGGEAPFAGTSVEDASGMLVPLLLAGPAAARVLADYLPEGSPAPARGRVEGTRLDRISALVAHVDAPGAAGECYLVLVPPASARALWRSLLSFPEVSPVGHDALAGLARDLPWGELASGDGVLRASRGSLEAWGLVRDGQDFVGGRALAAAPGGGER